ncbi:endonuclease domain-containing protein [Natronoglycomyces albus]
MKAWHGGSCAICGVKPEKLDLDHDHDSGLIRGFLCRSCNAREARSQDEVFVRYRHRNPASILGLKIVYSKSISRHTQYPRPSYGISRCKPRFELTATERPRVGSSNSLFDMPLYCTLGETHNRPHAPARLRSTPGLIIRCTYDRNGHKVMASTKAG